MSSFGKYRLIAALGHGGMADVFLAVADGIQGSGFSKLHVIKRLRPNLAEDRGFVGMLMDEARLAARLNHPNVVQTHEVGVEDGQYFIAMEYIEGQPFNRLLARTADQTVPFRELQYRILVDVLAGVHHAHELKDYDGTPLGTVHRDVTPHNVLVTYEGQVKLVDFGIAKAERRACQTEDGAVKGKVRYMAPEQLRGDNVDRTCDIFAIGVMLWEATTGRRFWGEMRDVEIVGALLHGLYEPSPQKVVRDVPDAIDAICRKALAVDPKERWASAAEFQCALEEYLLTSGQFRQLRNDLGPFVTQLFEVEREKTRADIEAQIMGSEPRIQLPLGGSQARTSSPEHPTPPGVELPGYTSRQSISTKRNHSTLQPYEEATRVIPPDAPKRAKGRAIGLGVGMFAVALGLLFFARSHAPAASANAGPRPLDEMQGSGPPALPAPEAETFALTIESSPTDANIFERGALVGKTPMTIDVRDADVKTSPRVFEVVKAGYGSREVSQGVSTSDMRVSVELAPLAPAATAVVVVASATPSRALPRGANSANIKPPPSSTTHKRPANVDIDLTR